MGASTTMQKWSQFFSLSLVLCIALAARIGLILLDGVGVSPDGRGYLRIADNLILNGCYSISPSDEGICRPTWYNQPPGYPVFIALVKLAISNDPIAIVGVQSLLFSVAVAYSLQAAAPFFRSSMGLILAGLVLGLSPLSLPWSRWVLTETLAAAGALWVAAECLRSLALGKFRTLHISWALMATALVRWDMIWIFILVIVVAWHLLGPFKAVAKLSLVTGIVSIPFLLLFVRAWAVGLPVFPSPLTASDEDVPPGIVSFWRVASIDQSVTKTLVFRVWNRRYDRIARDFDLNGVSDKIDSGALRRALSDLSKVPKGELVPGKLDNSFAQLAETLLRDHPYHHMFVTPVERFMGIWTGITDKTWRFSPYEHYILVYRWTILLALIVAVGLSHRIGPVERVILRGVLLFIFARTAFLVSLTCLESRYLTPFYSIGELVAMLSLSNVIFYYNTRVSSNS